MAKFESPLNNIKVASPCSMNWDEMYGNERKRFCGDCKLNVYNLSGMTRDEAENLIINTEGRLCVKFYKRADGSIITKDCPVGWAKVRQRAQMVATAVFSLVLSLFGGLLFASFFSRQKEIGGSRWIPFATPTPNKLVMGKMSPRPSPTPTPKATPDERKMMGVMVRPEKKTSEGTVDEVKPSVN